MLLLISVIRSRDSVVGMRRTSNELRLDSRVRQKISSVLQSVQTGSGAHSASYSKDVGSHCPISHPVSGREAISLMCGG
jgi:hypothetical protein